MRSGATVLCLSHLRWNFVYQRPQHLLTRCAAREQTVIFFEEPLFDCNPARLEIIDTQENVRVVVPHLPRETPHDSVDVILRGLLDELLATMMPSQLVLWYYTPLALGFTDHLKPAVTVYDCMDELSLFQGASPALAGFEQRLLQRADVVFTGGHSLFEHKRHHHKNIHPFPSSVDVAHFAQARELQPDPADQEAIAHPRIGFFGVIDERMNLELLAELADDRPDFQIVMIGPVVKIDPATLPQRENIHWLGSKRYTELPRYLAGWDVAMLPFALNESTRFISPTKTPEYLAAGKPVISTSIRDVVRPYGEQGLVWIADTAVDFALVIDEALASDRDARLAHADAFLSDMSWDRTWHRMWRQVERVMTPGTQRKPAAPASTSAGVVMAKQGQ